jgi:hypothetical protein
VIGAAETFAVEMPLVGRDLVVAVVIEAGKPRAVQSSNWVLTIGVFEIIHAVLLARTAAARPDFVAGEHAVTVPISTERLVAAIPLVA